MEILRTPDDRFRHLADWPHQPRYVVLDGIRVAVYEFGVADDPVVLLLHGEPTWSYLYRSMISPLVDAHLRVVAIDLVGFGRSDKPAATSDYTYRRHVDWLTSVVMQHLQLTGITLFCHDWGGLLGLRLVAEFPERFDRVVAANTFLPMGSPPPPGGDFMSWREFSQRTAELPIGQIVNSASIRELARPEIAGYDAPFPDESFKSGARRFPVLVPISPDDPECAANISAWDALSRYDKPFLTIFSDSDPVTSGAQSILQEHIPGAAGQPHAIVHGGHFLQEDAGPEIALLVVEFIKASPVTAS